MTTEPLTGRELDAVVAEAMGYPVCGPDVKFIGQEPDYHDPHGGKIKAYSAPDCSGLAPALAWLEANRGRFQQLVLSEMDGWSARMVACGEYADETIEEAEGDTLPEAACRLLVAWAGKRAEPRP